MKPFLILLLAAITAAADATTLPAISLYPEQELGLRGRGVFQSVRWSTDCEWFDKPAPVCRRVDQPMDFSPIHELAAAYGMQLCWDDDAERIWGPREEGAFQYQMAHPNHPYVSAGGSRKRRLFQFTATPYKEYEEDENGLPMVGPLPDKEEAVAMAREWMLKLGFDANGLYLPIDGSESFDVQIDTHSTVGIDPATKETRKYPFGMTLHFTQQIGGLPCLTNGLGGIICMIADGPEFSSLYGVLSRWETIGDYPVLNREELTNALMERFFWVMDPISCETLEVVALQLCVCHARIGEPQEDFPLAYRMKCKLHGGRDDGKTRTILVPALAQHRHRYGPPPDLSERELVQSPWKPAIILPGESE